jgi:hypothetical protein
MLQLGALNRTAANRVAEYRLVSDRHELQWIVIGVQALLSDHADLEITLALLSGTRER